MPALPEQILATESRDRRTVIPVFALPGTRAPAFVGLVAGCLPMALGLGIWLLFWYGDAEPPTGLRKWGSALFAAVFFCFGLRFAMESFWPSGRRSARRGERGSEIWGEGYPWHREMAPYVGGSGSVAKSIAGLLALTLFGAAINLPLIDMGEVTGDAWLAWILIPLFDLLILLILVSALWEMIQRLRFGRPRLILDSFPAAPGGTLAATFVAARSAHLIQPPTLRLTCVEQTRQESRTPNGFEVRLVAEAIYTLERRLTAAEVPPGRFERVEIFLPIPSDLPATHLKANGGPCRYWLLEVTLPMPGPDAAYPFLVPVYAAASA